MPAIIGTPVKNANRTIVHGDAVWKTNPQDAEWDTKQASNPHVVEPIPHFNSLAKEPDNYKPPVRMRV